MGKGSKRRTFNKKREASFQANHREVFGSSEPSTAPPKMVYVMREGKLVEKNQGLGSLFLPLGPNKFAGLQDWDRRVAFLKSGIPPDDRHGVGK